MHSLVFFGRFTQLFNHHHLTSECFHHPKKNHFNLLAVGSFPLHSSPWLPLIYFLLMWIWTFYINGIIPYVDFCVSLHLACFKDHLLGACVSTSFLLVHCVGIPRFVYPLVGYLGLFSLFVYFKQCGYQYSFTYTYNQAW